MRQTTKFFCFLTVGKVGKVHAPDEGNGCIPIDMSELKVFKDEFLPPEEKWDGGWHGDEASRIAYLRKHANLCAFCRPEFC